MIRIVFIFSFSLFLGCADEFAEAPPEPKRTPKIETKKPGEAPWPSTTCDKDDVALFSKNAAFSKRWRECSRRTWGDYTSTINCLRQEFRELRSSCASCFGAFTVCGKKNCSWWTCKTDNIDCDKCGWSNCGTELEKCLGFVRTTLYEFH